MLLESPFRFGQDGGHEMGELVREIAGYNFLVDGVRDHEWGVDGVFELEAVDHGLRHVEHCV